MMGRFVLLAGVLTLHTGFQNSVVHSFVVGRGAYSSPPPGAGTLSRETQLFAEVPPQQSTPLCDLQTFLRLTDCVSTGGAAKNVIQAGECCLNGQVETRRAKKLFDGDEVTFDGVTQNVARVIAEKGYVYKIKEKKTKPSPMVDADGNLEFGGRYRSEEWRAERKLKKAERKNSK